MSIGLGAAFTKDDAQAAGYIKVPNLVADAFAAAGKSYLEATWRRCALRLWQIERDWQRSMKRKLGQRRLPPKPGDFKHNLRTDRHLKTIERHLREMDELGVLERSGVRGFPRRGPGTRVRYWLVHALNLSPAAAMAKPEGPPPSEAQSRQEAAEPPQRGPPDEWDGVHDPGTITGRLKGRYSR